MRSLRCCVCTDSYEPPITPISSTAAMRSPRIMEVVTVHIAEQLTQLFEGCGIDSTLFLQAVMCTRAKLIKIPSGLGYANNDGPGDLEKP